MIGLVIAAEMTPSKPFDCILDPSADIGDRCLPMPYNEPNPYDYFQSYTKFFFLVSGISLVAFGGSILGILLRFGP